MRAHRPSVYGPPLGILVWASRWCKRKELRDLEGHLVKSKDLRGRVVGWDEPSKSFLVQFESGMSRPDGRSVTTKVPIKPEEMEEIVVDNNIPRAVWPTLVDLADKPAERLYDPADPGHAERALVRAESGDEEATSRPTAAVQATTARPEWNSLPGPPSHPPPPEGPNVSQEPSRSVEKFGPPMKAPPPGAMTQEAAQASAAGTGGTDAVHLGVPCKAPPKGATLSTATVPIAGDNRNPRLVMAPPPNLGSRPQDGPVIGPPPPLRRESITEFYGGAAGDPDDPWLADPSQSSGQPVAATASKPVLAPKMAPVDKLDHAITKRRNPPVQYRVGKTSETVEEDCRQ